MNTWPRRSAEINCTVLHSTCWYRHPTCSLQGVVNLQCKLISVTDPRLKAWCNPTLHLCNVFYELFPESSLRDWFIHGPETQLTEPWWATKSFVHFIARGRVFLIFFHVLVYTTGKGSFSLFLLLYQVPSKHKHKHTAGDSPLRAQGY